MSGTGIGNDSLEVTSAAAWRKARKDTVTCPSGAKVLIQRLSLTNMLLTGRVPEALAAEYLQSSRDYAERKKARGDEEPATAGEMLDLAAVSATVLVAAMESPRVVIEGADDARNEINIDDVPADDRAFLASYAISAADSVPVEMEGGESLRVGDLKSDGAEDEQERGAAITGDSGEGVRQESV
jgi:hypothetical protein